MIRFTRKPIDLEGLRETVSDRRAGATVVFVGTTREFTQDQRTDFLEYEAHEPLALREMRRLREIAMSRWPLVGCGIIHRLGRVDVSEASVAIVVSAPHRQDAFEASMWLMDEIKRVVPIRKREHWSDGRSEWIHPLGETLAKPSPVSVEQASPSAAPPQLPRHSS